MRLRVLSVALLLLACGRSEPARFVEAGRMGRVALFPPEGEGNAFVYLFSDARGWGASDDASARRLAAEGAAVVGVDLRSYLAGLAATREDRCHYTVAELEDWSHRFQRELGYVRYRSPILAGVGAGGTLAYAALAQSPAATLAGAAAVDPAPSLATRVPLCAGATSHAAAEGGFSYETRSDLPGWFRRAPADPAQGPAQRLVALVETSPEPPAGSEEGVSDLPLVEIPASRPSQRLAVIYSGDGGWRDLDKQIGEYLAGHGTPVVGVDSLRYFWTAKTPDAVALDLARILQYYRKEWGAKEVILVGYSFGAGILPFAVNRLAPAVRAAVLEISLLGLEPRAPFEIAVEGWLGGLPEGSPEVLPELVRLDLSRVQCVYGEEEEETLCRAPALAGAEVIRTEGGHHFGGDYEALARRILAGAERRAAQPGSG